MTRTGPLIIGDYSPVCAIMHYRQGVLPISHNLWRGNEADRKTNCYAFGLRGFLHLQSDGASSHFVTGFLSLKILYSVTVTELCKFDNFPACREG